jgi:hypothetical protein
MNGLHVQRVAEHEGDRFFLAEIGQPVPGEHALGGDRQTFAIRADERQKPIGPRLDVLVDQHSASLIDEANVHASRVQIDATIEWMLLLIKPHHGSPWKREVVEPA